MGFSFVLAHDDVFGDTQNRPGGEHVVDPIEVVTADVDRIWSSVEQLDELDELSLGTGVMVDLVDN